MKKLNIIWQRLVTEKGKTCLRCSGTGKELDRAVSQLKKMGILVKLEKKVLSPAAFKAKPLESNRIIINKKSLEYWLLAGVGSSRCCAECGYEECRTIEVNDRSYETIPAELIVRAGLAASRCA